MISRLIDCHGDKVVAELNQSLRHASALQQQLMSIDTTSLSNINRLQLRAIEDSVADAMMNLGDLRANLQTQD
jgi:hypothetical protein